MPADSPFKSTVGAATRESMTANLKESGLPKQLTVADFARAFFRNALPDSDCAPCIPDDAPTILAEIGRSNEKKAYKPTCKLLTGMCDKYAGIYSVAGDDQLAFVPHSDHSPCQHPHSYTAAVATQKPDLVVTKKWMAKQFLADVTSWTNAKRSTGKKSPKPAVAWPVIMGSLVEGKGASGPNGHLQAATYLGSLLLARPDLIGCLGLAIAPKHFRLIWCDVSGVFYTNTIQWSDPRATTILVQYIRQLHFPLVDSTVRLAPRDRSSDTQDYDVWSDKSYAAPPVWFVDDELHKYVYVAEKILSVGPAWSRKNWVARASERLLHRNDPDGRLKLDPPIVIKDSFIRPERATLSSEGDILEHIHRKGQVPGVVTMDSQYRVLHDDKETPVSNVQLPPELDSNLRAPTRVRYRLFLPEYDLDHIFTACSSVQECLEVIYDVLEMSRYLHEEHGITHRDINPFNVLVTRNAPTLTVPASEKYQPVFIRQLLSYQDPKPAPNAPACLLLDFDNAFWADRATGAPRTATPGFVARTLVLRRLVGAYRFENLPPVTPLSGMAKDAYLHFHGQQRYELASAFHADIVLAELNAVPNLGSSSARGADDSEENPFNPVVTSRPSPQDRFANSAVIPHDPRHDAESAYWVLSWSLLTALPRGALIKNDDAKPMNQMIAHFDEHRVGLTLVKDQRNSVLDLDVFEWQAVLHEGFSSIAPFLSKLNRVVKPEYGWVKSALNPYHLHEAMQRIVLEEVFRLRQQGDPLNIDLQSRRKVESRSPADQGLAATAMRVHAACSARKPVTAASQPTEERPQTRSQKRSLPTSTWPGSQASTSDVANDRQKKRKTAKDAEMPTLAETGQSEPRGQ